MINKMMVLCLGLAAISFAGAAEQPNIVIFLADDHGRAESSVYGSHEVRTPMMASLAKNGLVFDNAFVASPACGPSRSAMLSGLMPARNGAKINHQGPRPETQIMVKQLQAAGYEVAAFGKVAHFPKLVSFDEHFPNNTGLAENVKKYLNQRKSDKPLCLIVGDRRPHVPWTRKMDYDPAKITLPSHFVDTPETREHWARYLTDITGMDAEMAKVEALARGYFGNDDFLFMFTSDHGGQWPFGKWNLYDSGINVPMIVRWPGKIAADTRTEAMVSWIDIFPTLLDLTGGTIPANIDGKSFAGVLLGKADTHRDVIFTTTTADGDKNIYPMRSVRTERFKYIRNINPDAHHSNHSDILRNDGAGGYWDSWDEAAKTDPKAKAIIAKYYQRPAIEFYDLEKDPNEQVNLANNPEYKDQVAKMSSMVDEWMKEQGDTVRKKTGPYPLSGPTPHELLLQKREARATNARAQIKIKTVVPTSQNKPVSWRYTLDTPKEDWFNTDFDDSAWKTGNAPFGKEAPAASRKPNTVWTSKDIWLRREFEMPAGKFEDLSLILNYDENATIYINGVLAAKAPGYNGAYERVKLTPKAIAAIKPGKNRFAVHCRNAAGGQYIDLGLGVSQSTSLPITATANAADNAVVSSARHGVYASDRGKVLKFDADGKVVWSFKAAPVHRIQQLENGNIVCNTDRWRKVIEVSPDGKVVWTYDAQNSNGNKGKRLEVHAFQRLANGNTMIVENGIGRIIEVDAAGKIQHELRYKVEKLHAHHDVRQGHKLDNGNYLLCHEGEGRVTEYAPNGDVVWDYPVPLFDKQRKGGHGPDACGNQVFNAVRLPNGNTLIATGNGHSVLEVNAKKDIVWKVMQKDLPGITLAWTTSLELLPSGNIMIGNCHAGPDNPQLIEISRDKKVVWTFKDFKNLGNSTPASATVGVKGKVVR